MSQTKHIKYAFALISILMSCGSLNRTTSDKFMDSISVYLDSYNDSWKLMSDTQMPECVVLKEYYHGIWEGPIESHPNNHHGDYIILNSQMRLSNDVSTYAEHIAAYDYDEFGIWRIRNDSLFMKPVLSARYNSGEIIIKQLESAKEKVFWMNSECAYEVTQYEYQFFHGQRITRYDTDLSWYLQKRETKAGWMQWQRCFKVLDNKVFTDKPATRTLRKRKNTSSEEYHRVRTETQTPDFVLLKEFYDPRRLWPMDPDYLETHPNNSLGDYIVLNYPLEHVNGIKTYTQHIAQAGYDEYGEWRLSQDTLILKPLVYSFFQNEHPELRLISKNDSYEKRFVADTYNSTDFGFRRVDSTSGRFERTAKDEPTAYFDYRLRRGANDGIPNEYKIIINKDSLAFLFRKTN